MPIEQDDKISVDEIFQAAEGEDVTGIADSAALRQQFAKKFDYDPEVSLWEENELKKRQAAEKLKRQQERNAAELAKFHQSETRTKIGLDDMDSLGAIGVGIGSLNFKQMSSNQIEDKILNIIPRIAPQKSQQARKYMEDKTRQPKVYAPDTTNELIRIAREGTATNQKPKETNIAAPITERSGSVLGNALKRGAIDTVYNTVSLLHDFGYNYFEKGMEAAGGKDIGQPINTGAQPITNKLFLAMEKLKNDKYAPSQSMTDLSMGADYAGEQAKAEGDSATWAAIKYMVDNGSLTDVAEILAETVPSLGIGLGTGAVARKTIGVAAERAVAKRAGMLARSAGEVVDPARLARFAAPVGGVIQGATIAATTDFVGSAGAEYSRAYSQGKNLGDAVDYAMTRSLTQAGVSGIGGSFLPLTFGNRLFTTLGQSTIQGVAGYASAYAGASAVGEELSPSEAALNTLMGAITALPEVVAVGAGEGISKRTITNEIENGLIDTALQGRAAQEDEQNVRASYFAGVMNNLIDRVKESKTAGRSPDTLRDYINQVREDTGAIDSVYIDVESFNQTLADHNIPLEDLFEMNPGLRDQWEKVEDISGTIRIPLDELLDMAYKIDNEPLLRQIVGSMRSDPLAPNAYEAGASLARSEKDIQVDIERIKQNYEQIRAGQNEVDSVEQLIKNDLKALDYGFEPNTGFNDQAGTLVGAMYESLAAKTGIPVKQLYEEMPVRIMSNQEQANIILGEMGLEEFKQSRSINLDEIGLTKNDFQNYLKEKYNLELGMTEKGNQLTVEKIIVPEDSRQSGIGTNAMKEILLYADLNNKIVSLTPSSDFGGNKKRLVEFYKSLGFIENKGRNKNYEISEAMYRDSAESFNQKTGKEARGKIQFRKDKKGAVIILGKNANFSTFTHEIGHHFLELNMMFARRDDAPEGLRLDMDTIMEWAKLGKKNQDWDSLTPAEKTQVHEKFAESFEQYMFTGKAPSNKLRQVFSRFRSFMAAVYKNMQRFMGINKRADLNPEISAVMDRMVATQEAIDQIQSQRNLDMVITPEMAKDMGIPDDEYKAMQQAHEDATEMAINELEQKTIKDLGWYRNLRNKHMNAFVSQAKRIRQRIREDVAEVVAEMPVYQAIAFLKQPVEKPAKVIRNPNVVDNTRDNLLEAIAKMGGIDADEIGSTWGIDQPESYKVNVGRVKKVARKGGLSIETVAERLAEYRYLDTDEYGRFDTRQLEDLFTDSLGGAVYHSLDADYGLFDFTNDYGMSYGSIEEFPVSGKLNLEWLKAKYGEDSEIYKSIPKNGKYGLTSVDGLDPEMVAERFGYTSADQMIREMVEAKPPKEVIEEMANNQIEAQHSDLFDEASVEQAIDEAVHNDLRGQMLARELAAVGKLNGKQAELNQSTKLAAADIISKTNIGDIRPHVFSATELRLSRAYDKALKSGNTIEAAQIKRSQLINFHATKLAYQVLGEVEGLNKLAKTITGNDAKLAKARDFNIVTIARYVLSQYDVIDLNVNVVEQLKAIRDYDPTAYSEVADLSGVSLSDKDTLTFTSIIDKDDVKSMTYEEFQTLNDVVRQLWFKSKENQKIRVGNEKIDLAIAVENLTSAADSKDTVSRKSKLDIGKIFKWERAIQSTRRAEQFFTWLDGGKANGFFHQYIFNRIQDGLSAYRNEQKKMYVAIRDIYKDFDHSYAGKIDAPELGGNKSVFDTKYELIHAILHSGNMSNKKRMVMGFKWGDLDENGNVVKDSNGMPSFDRWDKFIKRMFDEGVIKKQDMDAIQKVWNLFDGYKGQAQEVHKAMNGLYFKELPKSIVDTPFGVYEGGYIPADYDKDASPDAEVLGMKNEVSTKAEGFATAGVSTGANFTKSRVENFDGLPMVLDLSSLPMHLDRELRYIHLEQDLKQASKILRNKGLIRAMDRASPYSMISITKDWLETVASQKMYEQSKMPVLDKVVNTLKRNVGITFMAGNFKNSIEAMTSLSQVMVAVPKTELLVATGKFFTNAFSRESMTADVRAMSPFMDARLNRSADEARYQIDQFVVNPSKLKKVNDFLVQNSYIVQQVIQDPLEVVSWTAAFNDAKNTKGMNDADAVHHADGIVRMYLNDMSPEGISKLERGNPLVRAMLMFYGWFNMVSNTWRLNRQLINENPELGRIGKMGSHAALYTMMIALPSILSKALTLTFSGELLDNEEPEDWQDDAVMILGKSQFEMILGMLPFTRDAVNPIYKNITSTTSYVDRYTVSPILSMGDTVIKTGKLGVKAAENLAGEENDIDKSKATKDLLQAATFVTGIPFTLVQRPVTYGTDVLIDEDQEPENAGDVVRGVLSGK